MDDAGNGSRCSIRAIGGTDNMLWWESRKLKACGTQQMMLWPQGRALPWSRKEMTDTLGITLVGSTTLNTNLVLPNVVRRQTAAEHSGCMSV